MDNQRTTPSKPTFSPYQEGVQKALKNMGEQHTIEALQNGVPAQHIEQEAGLSQQDILNQILQLSQQQVAAKPEAGGGLMSGHVGLIGGLLNGVQGKGFNPMAQKTESLGLSNAIQLQGAMQTGQKNSMDMQKTPLEIQKLEGDISTQPLQKQKLQQEVAQGKVNLRQSQPGFQKNGTLSANDIFTKYEQAVQPYITQRDAYSRIKASSNDPSPAGDLAILYGYMKILDPGSTVREGEFATAQNSGSIPQRLQATYNKIISGKRLSEEQRNDFMDRAQRIFKSSDAQYSKTRKEYSKIAIANHLDPEAIARDVSLQETPNDAPNANAPKDNNKSLSDKEAYAEYLKMVKR